jgi:hypothetical protein
MSVMGIFQQLAASRWPGSIKSLKVRFAATWRMLFYDDKQETEPLY